jgi:hypothetical protein
MAGDRSSPGSDTSERLSRRLDNHLTRRAAPDGGEVFSGGLATRALSAVGARAMTLDQSIIVDNEFNLSRPEDQALYAHEQYHVEHSGGQAGHSVRDAEEVAARAVEAMVFHRAAAGGIEGGYNPGRGGSTDPSDRADHGYGAGVSSSEEKPATAETEPDADSGYWLLIEQGYSHQDIVEELARKTMAVMEESTQSGRERHRDKKAFL